MRQIPLSSVLLLSLLVHGGLVHAQTQRKPASGLPAAVPAARIVEIRGNLVTIADATGRRQTLEVTSSKGLKPGLPTGWCEDDCRTIPLGSSANQVKRRVPAP